FLPAHRHRARARALFARGCEQTGRNAHRHQQRVDARAAAAAPQGRPRQGGPCRRPCRTAGLRRIHSPTPPKTVQPPPLLSGNGGGSFFAAAAVILFHKKYTNVQGARKRALFCWSWRSAGPEGEGGCFDSPSLPPLDSLPTRNDQGGALDPKAESRSGRLAEKALYCASDGLRIAFSGRHPPCAPIGMRALRARLHPTRRTKKE